MVSVSAESKYSILEGLKPSELWEAALNLGFPSALWKLPHTREIKLLISTGNDIDKCQPDLEKLQAGFMLSPFKWEGDQDVFFMRGDIVITFSESGFAENINNVLGEEHPVFKKLVNLPEQKELWLGASPETLIQQKANGTFATMSLAGTQSASDQEGNIVPKYDIRWGQKEIEEQALVSRYIVECFKKIRLREYLETGPKTVLAGNLYHLRTDFEVDTVSLNFPELASVMLRLLHPTSAVCGVPKLPSLKFLLDVESHERTFYSGFLGPVQVDGDTNLFVNLRTVRLKNGKATFFAGAGITEDSIPEREWEETELKCDTLLKIIAKDF